MKSYEVVAQEVLERRDTYLKEKRRRKKAAGRAVSMIAGLCVVILAAAGIWRHGRSDSSPADVSPWELARALSESDGSMGSGDAENDSTAGNGYLQESGADSRIDGIFSTEDSNGNGQESGSIADRPGEDDSNASHTDSHTDGSYGSYGAESQAGNLPVSYSSLQLPPGQIKPDILTQYKSDLSTADILPFEESMLSDCCAILEGKITDMYLKNYSYDTYDDKFGPTETYHNQASSVVYELTVSKVWYGDQSLSGTSVLIEDETYLMDSYFSLKMGCSYVIPIYDAGETKQVWRYAGGDLTKDSRYATLYPYHPQIEVTLDGNYMVTSDWESLCSEKARDIQINLDTNSAEDSYPDTYIEYHPENEAGPDGFITTEWRTLLISRNDAFFYYDRLKLIDSNEFFIQLNQMIDRLP